MKQLFKQKPEYSKIKSFIQIFSDKYSNYYLINQHTFMRSKLNGDIHKCINTSSLIYFS